MGMKKSLLGVLLLGVLLSGGATSLWADEACDALWHKLHDITSMQAHFLQKVRVKQKVLSQSTGQMAFARPKHFRWDTKDPVPQLLVADGQQFWLYDIDLEQVTVRPQAALTGAAAGLFLGDDKARFAHDFTVTQTQGKQGIIFNLQANFAV